MNFEESAEFKKEVKALSKKVRTITSDLKPVYPLIERLYVSENNEELKKYRQLFFNGSVATILHKTDTHEVIKMRLDTETRSVRGKLRLIFIVVISKDKVTFIELYSKNAKSREDERRIQKYIS